MQLFKQAVALATLSTAAFASSATIYQLSYLPLGDTFYIQAIPYGYAGGQVFAAAVSGDYHSHPLLWTDTTLPPLDLTIAGTPYGAQGWGCSATDQVGSYVLDSEPTVSRAVRWLGAPTGFVDLHPTGIPNLQGSVAEGTNGRQQVGYIYFNNSTNIHAVVWDGTAASFADIHPSAAFPTDGSNAWRIADNGMIVGGIYGSAEHGYFQHACYWPNSSSQAIDINPPGFDSSFCFGVDGILQSGYAWRGGGYDIHAMVWGGTPDSAVDLGYGQVIGARNGMQVGWSSLGATVWHSTAASAQGLPGGSSMVATDVGEDGVIVGYDYSGGILRPVKWTPQAADTTPPTISNVSVSKVSIWPPNKKMIPVTVYFDAVDDQTDVTTTLSISCNEAVPASGMVVVDPHQVKLLADRNAKGSGRVYTILITCTDQAGNSSTATATVTVPHDQS